MNINDKVKVTINSFRSSSLALALWCNIRYSSNRSSMGTYESVWPRLEHGYD